MGLADDAHQLLDEQKRQWDLLRDGYASLERVETRTFELDGFVLKVQFNPGRITSSAAKVDEKTIRERPCFLCPQNRPKPQREIRIDEDLVLLCNPFPIFPEHFTIPTLSHTPQRILHNFVTMLELARQLSPRYTVFYNGPRCGASAPDHLHFQAGTRGFMPIEDSLPDEEPLRGVQIRFVGDLQRRNHLVMEGADARQLETAFQQFYRNLQSIAGNDADEPMMNILATFDAAAWRVYLFPRAKHRPSFYDAEGDARILLSPAAVDLGGVCITPLRRDFERVDETLLLQMFREVTLSPDAYRRLEAMM